MGAGAVASQRPAAALLALFACGCMSVPQTAGFGTPEALLYELANTIGTHDHARAERLLGADGPEMLQSGDEVADRVDGARVQQYIREKIAFEEHGSDTRIALLGNDAWPFPIPHVRKDGAWHFDVEAGVEEIANRRIGRTELSTIATPRAFAAKLFSSEGKHDGLYWPTAEGEAERPFGPLVAEVAIQGCKHAEGEPRPYHGDCCRLPPGQGSHAPGVKLACMSGVASWDPAGD